MYQHIITGITISEEQYLSLTVFGRNSYVKVEEDESDDLDGILPNIGLDKNED